MTGRTWTTYCVLVRMATATPNIAFPFNSQVPAVARMNTAYDFQISESTFAPASTNFSYSLSNQPAWLAIDSATRTLRGTPGQGDVGSSTFTLTAADGTGAAHMGCTLVVSSDIAPQLSGDISKQLAATANLSSSRPPVVTLLPSTVFQFDFKQESFIDIVQRKLYYYATLSDHTPLPSWLEFDTTLLTFSGTAPSLSAFPQSWEIQLIASDVPGFSATEASFTISIGTEQLAFVPEEQDLNITAGKHIQMTSLRGQLFRNGVNLPAAEWRDVETCSLPPWLSLDTSTLTIEGDVPEDVEQQNFTVTVSDTLGNAATAIVNLAPNNATLFNGQIGTIAAAAGDNVRYHFDDSLFSEADLNLDVVLPSGTQWLHFNPSSRELLGTVPMAAEAETSKATLTATPSDGGKSQSQVFTIDIKAAAANTPTSSSLSTRTLPTQSSTSPPGAALGTEKARSSPSGGVIAAIVVVSLVGAALLVVCLIWCCRRRRRRTYDRQSPSQKPISRPVPPPHNCDTITVTTELQRDVEKSAGSDEEKETAVLPSKAEERPPQITLNSLNLPSNPATRKPRWSRRFSRLSYASSIGQGDATIRADSNIPELGQDAPGLHTPHDSFSVATEMARNSRHLSQLSPSKRTHRVSNIRRQSKSDVGLGISTSATGGIARHSSKRVDKHRRERSSFAGLSTTREASSMASMTTTRTSLLSTRPSQFPEPPQSEHTTSLSVPALSITTVDTLRDPKRKSIRMIQRSDSVADDRPLDVKRDSFIHNRVMAVKDRSRGSVQSPLFAHGSRASSLHARQTSRSANTSSTGSLRRTRRSKNGKSMLTTYSESSSLEPQPLDPRRSNTRDTKRLSERVKSAFAPNFPRVMSRHSVVVRPEDEDDYTTTNSSMNSSDWVEDEKPEWFKDAHKPRHERDWVLTHEASPTPPPARPESQSHSGSRLSIGPAEAGAPRSTWKARMQEKSSSPLSSNVQIIEPSSASPSREIRDGHHNRLSEPINLVSADSMHKGRPRLANTKSRRPLSVEEVQRLSSMKAERDEATTAGSEQWYDTGSEDSDLGGAGLAPRASSGRVGTQKSDMSGPAFL